MYKLEKKYCEDLSISEKDIENFILKNTDALPFGEIEIIKSQVVEQFGILDILCYDKRENIYYEIEVMVGEVDSIHIVHSMDYWANEKDKNPYGIHIAVLACESRKNRYNKLLSTLSNYIPFVFIEYDVFQIDDNIFLKFNPIFYGGKSIKINRNKKIKEVNDMFLSQNIIKFCDKVYNEPVFLQNNYRKMSKELSISLGSIAKYIAILKKNEIIDDNNKILNKEKLFEYLSYSKK